MFFVERMGVICGEIGYHLWRDIVSFVERKGILCGEIWCPLWIDRVSFMRDFRRDKVSFLER